MGKGLFVLLSCVLLFTASLRGQCPHRDTLWKRMQPFRDTSVLVLNTQLQEYLPHLDRMKNCPYKNDSIHALLFRRIGALYFKLGDFTNALEYYRQFINIFMENAGKPAVDIDMTKLPGGYYWLSVIYDSLNMVNEKWKALDNCMDIAEKIGNVDRSNLYSLYKRIISFYDIGDYYRCVEFAMRCETLGRIYSNANSGVEYRTGLDYTLTSLLWRINALLILKDYKSAEDLLINKADECKKNGFNDHLGMVYKQLADLEEHKGNYNKALEFLSQSLNCYRGKGFEFNRKQILNTIGLTIYFNHFKDSDKALYYYRNALKLVNKDESDNKDDAFENLSIMANIANVYVRKGLYDSAFHYFDHALNQIKPGINESTILESSSGEFSEQEKIYYRINLMIDKGIAHRKRYQVTGQV
ncbi:MAG: tetratricopeptide repeat protein, partial [Flavisolibacter sp.]